MARPSPATRAECRASSASVTADTTPACSEWRRSPPLEVRKATLATVLARVGHGIWFNDHIEGDGPTFFQPASETARPAFEPRKCPQIAGCSSETWKHRFALDCVVVDAARIEPVSTPRFPANRVINSVFCRLGPFAAIFASN